MMRIHSLAVRTPHAGKKLGPMSVLVSVSSVFRHPESDAPASDHKPVAPGPRPAPRCPRTLAPPAPAENVCDQMAAGFGTCARGWVR